MTPGEKKGLTKIINAQATIISILVLTNPEYEDVHSNTMDQLWEAARLLDLDAMEMVADLVNVKVPKLNSPT